MSKLGTLIVTDNVKYSDYFKLKGETLLEGTVLCIHKSSCRVWASIKYSKYIIDISDDNRHFGLCW